MNSKTCFGISLLLLFAVSCDQPAEESVEVVMDEFADSPLSPVPSFKSDKKEVVEEVEPVPVVEPPKEDPPKEKPKKKKKKKKKKKPSDEELKKKKEELRKKLEDIEDELEDMPQQQMVK